jgi:hypothetical protein
MAYESKWECLSLVLKRVMASGAAEKEAKRDLCNATADRKIRLRLRFTWRPTTQDFLTGRDKPDTEIRYVKKVQIPAILKPGDFDWRRSQVRKPELWRKRKIRGPSGSFLGNWRVIEIARYKAGDPLPHTQRGDRSLAYQHRVELYSADVTNVLCGGGMIHDEQAGAITKLQSGGAKSRGIKEAIKQLWPDGIPKGLSVQKIATMRLSIN